MFTSRTDILLSDEKNKMVVLLALDAVGERFDVKSFNDFLVSSEDDPNCIKPDENSFISTPHSNSFLDLNGDCMADIFLQKTAPAQGGQGFQHFYEIYTQKYAQGRQMYCLNAENSKKHLVEAGQRRPLTDPK